MIGTKLGAYELIEEIGHGGMATVFRAYQPNVDRFVAVKVIHRSIALDSKSLDRFTREARLVARLEHPHILPVYDYNGLNDPPYIVMRYLPTGTLKDILERESLPHGEVVYLMTQIGAALDYAHRQGVVHRDIKPSNIMVDSEGNAFLTDFGIARMVEGGEGLTGSGMAIGTPGYMAPEQGLGSPVDGRADIYALAVMVFEMLTGRVPYSAETPMAVILKHINDPVPDITAVDPQLPPGINAVLQRAMAKNPDDRYPTASEFSRALSSALGSSSNVTPVKLQAVAAQTIQDLEQQRKDLAARAPQQMTTMPDAAPQAEQKSGPASGSVNISQTMSRPAVQGAAAGIGIFVLLLLIAGGVLMVMNNNASAAATATYVAGLQADIANSTATAAQAAQIALNATNTAANLPTEPPTKIVAAVPTATNTTPPTFTPVPPTVTATLTPVPPTATFTTEPPPTVVPTIVPTVAPTTAVAVVPTTVAPDPNANQTALFSGKLPYLNDMENIQAIEGWDYDENVWKLQVDSGNVSLVGSGDFNSPAVVLSGKSPEWISQQNLILTLNLRLDLASSIARIAFRHSDTGYYLMEMRQGNVNIKRGKTADVTKIREERIVANVINTTIRSGTWYQVEIWSSENRVYVYVDHRLVLTSRDVEDPLPGGNIIFQSYNKNFRTRFDNFKVQIPLQASQHFDGSDWPGTWGRSSEAGAKIVSGNNNGYIQISDGDVFPINPPVEDLRMSCRIWNTSGGMQMRIRESKAGVILFDFSAGNLIIKQLDASQKTIKQWTLPSFYGRGDFIDLAVETIGDRLRIFKEPQNVVFTEVLQNAPPAGAIRFTANPANKDEFRIDDCFFTETGLSQTEDASWALNKVTEVEARPVRTLLSEWYDRFDDQFRTRDWWENGANAPGEFKVAALDTQHPNYLEMTTGQRIFRYVREFYVFGTGSDKTNFYDASDIYLKVDVRIPNAGTAWIAARTSQSVGGGNLNGYRIELTRAQDGTYSVRAKAYSLAGEPVYYEGEVPELPGSTTPDWVKLLIVCYHDKVAFFANGRFIGAEDAATMLSGTIALGVEPGTTAHFDDLELRDVSPETR